MLFSTNNSWEYIVTTRTPKKSQQVEPLHSILLQIRHKWFMPLEITVYVWYVYIFICIQSIDIDFLDEWFPTHVFLFKVENKNKKITFTQKSRTQMLTFIMDKQYLLTNVMSALFSFLFFTIFYLKFNFICWLSSTVSFFVCLFEQHKNIKQFFCHAHEPEF